MSSNISNLASSSTSQSKEDQESGSNATMLKNDEAPSRNSDHFLCIPLGMGLNPTRMLIAELVGTFILMFCVGGIIASTELLRGEVGLLEYAATAGLTVIVVVYTIGPISGAHVNPSVTIAFAVFGHFPWTRVPLYILAQTIGSLLGAFAAKSIYGIESDSLTTQPLHGISSAFFAELLSTFIVVFLATALAYDAETIGNLSGFIVGVAIGLAVLITGPLSGGSMNPARSLGPAILSGNFKHIWIYMIAPTVGAITGALMYRFIRLRPLPPLPGSSTVATDAGLVSHSVVIVRS